MNNWWIAYLCIASISIASNVITVIIGRFAIPTSVAGTSKLFIFIQVSNLLQIIGSLPDVYTYNHKLCKFMGFLHYYGGLANMCAIAAFTTIYLNFVSGNIQRNLHLLLFWKYFIFLFPLIAFLPFSTNAYGAHDSAWCTVDLYGRTGQLWAWFTVYLWVTLTLLFTASAGFYSCWKSAKTGSTTYDRLFLAVAGYIMVFWVNFLPKVIPRFLKLFLNFTMSDSEQFFSSIGVCLAGLGYAICFYCNCSLFIKIENLVNSGKAVTLGGEMTEKSELDLNKVLEGMESSFGGSFSMNPLSEIRMSKRFSIKDDSNIQK